MTNRPYRNQINRMNFLNENGLRLVFLFVCFLTASWTTLDQAATAERRRLPLVINTWSFTEATKAAWQELNKPEGSVLDAVEVGCSTCEELQCDGSVGYGSHPDETGRVTLDALIMDGRTQNVGAVAAMHSIKNAIGVARKVLDHTQHSLLVGDAATQFAVALGFRTESLETENSNKQHNDWLNSRCQPNFWANVRPDPSSNCGPYTPSKSNLRHATSDNRLDEAGPRADIHSHDTIGMIAIDANGRIAVGTSTNGANHKIPGRVGDTAIPGSGGYADNELGAAACTGDGDVIMRYTPAALAVYHLEQGRTPWEAAELALRRARERNPKNQAAIVVVNKSGDYGAACFNMDKFPFSFMNSELPQVHYVDCFDKKER